jgi:hypothetical protein
MTKKTRRSLVVCLVAIAVLLPVESVLLRAISTPDSREAVKEYVGSLSASELRQASGEIKYYPLAYRRAIMGRLGPVERSTVWQEHLEGYLNARPDLSETAVITIEAAISVMGPGLFANPTRAARDQVRMVSEQLVELLGREEAEYLMYRLGPVDGTFASLEPLSERLANYVRQMAVALAREDDCQCSTEFGCDGMFTHCSDEESCDPDEEWPACGWGWFEDCNGLCMPGMAGA